MKLIPLENASLTVRELAAMAKEESIVITENGEPVLSVKNVAGSDWESVALASNPRFQALIEESRRAYREQGGIGIEQIRQELGIE
jgi:hypothetical protein